MKLFNYAPRRVVIVLFAGFLPLIFFSAPASLSKFLVASLRNDLVPQALVGLIRGDVVDA
jgi:hypothetical protein